MEPRNPGPRKHLVVQRLLAALIHFTTARAQTVPPDWRHVQTCELSRGAWCRTEPVTASDLPLLNQRGMHLPPNATTTAQLACFSYTETYESMFDVSPSECTAFPGGHSLPKDYGYDDPKLSIHHNYSLIFADCCPPTLAPRPPGPDRPACLSL